MKDNLTPKQRIFVSEYLIDQNATRAAKSAGYSEKTAHSQGQRLLKNVGVKAELEKGFEEKRQRNNIDADWVLNQAVELHERCMQKVTPVMVRDGKDMVQATDENGKPVYKFDAAGSAKGLEIVGKCLGAFSEKREHDVGDNLAAIIRESRKRVQRED